eukprot:Nitzschia sp. Nitz4//scaffold138_size62050//25030//27297//NITZ4_006387-RA/size62050-processed-gene-0.61-mRNA-1//-1//CDS//3329535764//6008//frame0
MTETPQASKIITSFSPQSVISLKDIDDLSNKKGYNPVDAYNAIGPHFETSPATAKLNDSITFGAQHRLPPLPIPNLEDTMKKVLLHVEALHASEAEKEEAKRAVEEFLKGDGPKLQQMLVEYDKTGRARGDFGSYVEEFWNDSYLPPDSVGVQNFNPYFVLENSPDPSLAHFPIKRAASLCSAALGFASQVQQETLRADSFRGKPLCMEQFKSLFGSARVAVEDGVDVIRTYDDSNHVVVMCQGDMYYFQALWPNGDVAVDEGDLVEILTAIRTRADQDVEEEDPVFRAQQSIGVLTSLPLKERARARRELTEFSPDNEDALQIVYSALFVLVLDDYKPEDKHAVAANMLHGSYALHPCPPPKDEAAAKQRVLSFPEYQGGSCCNRWYDKLQIIVCGDGSAGVNFEHSSIDGHTALRFVSDIYAESVISFAQSITRLVATHDIIPNVINATVRRAADSLDHRGLPQLDVLPKKLHFNIPESIQKKVYYAETALGDDIMSMDTFIFDFKAYGKEFIKAHNMSPDSYVQMSLILAYYRLYGQVVCSYEPVLTKGFYHGRTEAMRSTTMEARRLCEVFMDRKRTNGEKIAALHAAIYAHGQLVKDCSEGKGVDRHLFALKCIAEKNGMKTPAFFQSKPWNQLNHTILSTSNCGNACLAGFGFGPVVPEGFGIGYIIKDNQLHYGISSKQRQTRRFALVLEKVLVDMANLFTLTKKGRLVKSTWIANPRKSLTSLTPDMVSYEGYDDVWGESTLLDVSM